MSAIFVIGNIENMDISCIRIRQTHNTQEITETTQGPAPVSMKMVTALMAVVRDW